MTVSIFNIIDYLEIPNNPIDIFSSFSENDLDLSEGHLLLGHSLTWSNDKNNVPHHVKDNKLCAKIWYPSSADDADMINLASYSSDFSNIS